MISKQYLRELFKKEWQKHYSNKMFEENGFRRYVCKSCGKGFWSMTEMDVCGDVGCTGEYSFIGNSLKKMDYHGVWKKFEKYFVSKGHESVKRYPVICRWREDLYFTNASIVDFQRLEDHKITFEYPSDKLVVPQISLRFNDIANVGVTGRHFTSFQMSGQHAFGYPDSGYWKDECLTYNFEFLTKVFGIKPEKLTYVEDVWTMPDFSAFGPCIEAFADGLELVNSVFMEFTWMKNEIHKLPLKVIDVGWGHDRLVWYTNGSVTSYEAVFGDVVDRVRKEISLDYDPELFVRFSKISGILDMDEHDVEKSWKVIGEKLGEDPEYLRKTLEPVQAFYAILDHVRTVLFAVTDGGLPSNAGGGYNLRILLRRAFTFDQKFSFNLDFTKVAEYHANYLKNMFPELMEGTELFSVVVELERRKYLELVERARREIKSRIEKNPRFSKDELVIMYESRGITPELIKEVAEELGKEVELPLDFYYEITSAHIMEKKEEETMDIDVVGFPETEILYYDDVYEFKARVLKCEQLDNGYAVVLDRTAFYPRSGGQDCDTGYIGDSQVVEVRKIGGVVIHIVDSPVSGDVVCSVDKKRRNILSTHHTAVHILNGACRRVLGKHVWQHGSEKTTEKARLDITHYELPSKEEIEEIERLCNEIIKKDLPVNKHVMDREEAEKKYGFIIYQGGAVPSKQLRIIKIPEWDVEACGGIHRNSTREVDLIKIVNVSKIQDGVVRFEIVAGDVAKEVLLSESRVLREISDILGVQKENLLNAVSNLRDELKSARKEVERLRKLTARMYVEKVDSDTVVEYISGATMELLEEIGNGLKKKGVSTCVLISDGIVYGFGDREAITEAAKVMGGSAGGREEFKGGGPLKDKAREAFETVRKILLTEK